MSPDRSASSAASAPGSSSPAPAPTTTSPRTSEPPRLTEQSGTTAPTVLVIAAAGSGTRLGAGIPKALAPLPDGRALLEHCLDAVVAARDAGTRVDAVVVLVPPAPGPAAEVQRLVDARRAELGVRVTCVPGGAERADSVRAGLAAAAEALADLAPTGPAPTGSGPARPASAARRVLIHDAARALTPPEVFLAVQSALDSGALGAIPGLPVTDTVKQVDPAQELPTVVATPPRAALRAVQTPQGFDLDVLLAAHESARIRPGADPAALTDDAMALEAAGHTVVVVPGHPEAFKVTAPEDLDAAAAHLGARASAQDPAASAQDPAASAPASAQGPVPSSPAVQGPAAPTPAPPAMPRTGIGTDVHAWAPEDAPRPLWLGCIEWPGQNGAAATSDGDVAAHAACNALLSAAGLGDLGAVFGVDRPEMAGASGADMLAEVARLVTGAGFRIGNVAVQVVAPRPKVGTRRVEMEAAMSAALGGAVVSVSAATTDRLGFVGRREGLVGIATAILAPA
ncbi:2-C-methyl-D-erythritol 2,4-cyclodiphosphate synthase [Micrococcus sp.]|uniref:2-C-methyl-D-erythritol 2,4-cyclodiphosphate synthase n=1 Tax=Micrococcus sp. TaxID=1271 RepID=UPI002A90F1C7|nr:2-C-methyl-D-erythritol 2,4-cyclodiphosphate synthase [Micrococcus sp.]MDY6054739.1 2-C-methyl-D-erythritol 2,4-cyclodiphosphate synthase [Micrococcus sp.]